MDLSRRARPSFQTSAAGVHMNGWVRTDVGTHNVQYTGKEGPYKWVGSYRRRYIV
ncbi:14973_t:CDS:2 [Entrophospora sp. SA101]|nr:15083_t:CDS:2 [Entrophospora sp. SA101]CAJ0757084.1 14973_t:CDS:2 [Entrophospora sp. SA101]CAJ0832939.1 4809_t:CDS:2 [Entrophospora sp. SA101]